MLLSITSRRNMKIGAIVVGSVTIGVAIYQGIEVRNGYRRSIKMDPPDGPVFGTEKFHVDVDKMMKSSLSLIKKSKEKVLLLNEKILVLNKEMKGII